MRLLIPPPFQGGGEGVGSVSNQNTRHRIQPVLRSRAAELRHTPTEPERRLWQLLRRSQLGGLKFRRQAVIEPYIVDFYCPRQKLVVEVDGESHVGRGDVDAVRTGHLKRLGYRIMRVTNDDVLGDIEAVGLAILEAARISQSSWVDPPTP